MHVGATGLGIKALSLPGARCQLHHNREKRLEIVFGTAEIVVTFAFEFKVRFFGVRCRSSSSALFWCR